MYTSMYLHTLISSMTCMKDTKSLYHAIIEYNQSYHQYFVNIKLLFYQLVYSHSHRHSSNTKYQNILLWFVCVLNVTRIVFMLSFLYYNIKVCQVFQRVSTVHYKDIVIFNLLWCSQCWLRDGSHLMLGFIALKIQNECDFKYTIYDSL